MSKYWNKLNIFRRDKEKNEQKDKLFLTDGKISIPTGKNDCKFIIVSSNDLQEISDFYCKNYRILKSQNTVKVFTTDLLRLLNVDAEIAIIRKEKRLIGSIVSILIPVCVSGYNGGLDIVSERFNKIKSEKSFVFACTSYLILENEFRGKGYGMSLIQNNLQTLHDNGGFGAYFINKVSRCNNSIPFNTWYFPTNFEKLDLCKYPYPKDYKIYFIEKMEKFSKCKSDMILVDYENCLSAYNFYYRQVEDKKFYFAPSYDYWVKWINSFPTYLCYKNEKIIGIFCFNTSHVKTPYSNENLHLGKLLFCLGDQPEILSDAICKGSESFDLLNFYELGDLTSKHFSSVLAQRTEKLYINFYNTSLNLKTSEFYSPIF